MSELPSKGQRFEGTCPTCGQRYCGELIEALQQIVDLSYKKFPKASLEVIEMTTIARRALERGKQ